MLFWIVATAAVIIRRHPDLLAERLGPRQAARAWDTAIVSVLSGLNAALLLIRTTLEDRGLQAELQE